MKPAARVYATVTILTCVVCPAHAVIVAQHNGSTDPTTEGWTPSAGSLPTGQTVGPIVDGGTPAWFVDDASGSSGSAYFYNDVLSVAEAADANSLGWTLLVALRVPSTGNPSGSSAGAQFFSPFVNYYDGDRYWWLGFDNDGSDTRVQTVTSFQGGNQPESPSVGDVFTVIGGASTFNTYLLQKAPGSMTASLYINGVLKSSTYAGALEVDQPPLVQWGSGSSLDSGRGNFNSVTFDIAPVPEAGSLAIWGSLGCAVLGIVQWRRLCAWLSRQP